MDNMTLWKGYLTDDTEPLIEKTINLKGNKTLTIYKTESKGKTKYIYWKQSTTHNKSTTIISEDKPISKSQLIELINDKTWKDDILTLLDNLYTTSYSSSTEINSDWNSSKSSWNY